MERVQKYVGSRRISSGGKTYFELKVIYLHTNDSESRNLEESLGL